ncbi:hypothetical protein PVL29_008747 [Vitis rotundifolia]|uniref:Uncharacterized protein n=1 Tax=Vitis rotundifolia TaxID=103349 RepID=A0AA39DWL5_VITRO|nr:hypothetical protein PVL29_008747 [Vitis rotundifolia]
MNSLVFLRPLTFSPSPPQSKLSVKNPSFRISFSSAQSNSVEAGEYKPGVFDDLFLNLFRSRMVKEVGWDSEKPGYDGLIDVANQLMMKSKSNSKVKEAAVRILISLFPPFLLDLYRMLIAPIGGGKVAAMMVARVTALSCQWLMGLCTVNSVNLPDGSSCSSGVAFRTCLRFLYKAEIHSYKPAILDSIFQWVGCSCRCLWKNASI